MYQTHISLYSQEWSATGSYHCFKILKGGYNYDDGLDSVLALLKLEFVPNYLE